jgi:tripeptide aminopeptidase
MYTEGYEGFFHLDAINGNVEEVRADYIIRDHAMDKFEEKKQIFLDAAEYINKKYGAGTLEVKMKDSYYNMRNIIEDNMHLIDKVEESMRELEITPIITPIRGGTDGARLSFMGLPCPNICTGGENFHGKYEYVCVQSMEKIVELLIKLGQKFAI